ncbi:alpha/beta-Hydrolases superfamily protein, partial [Striga asiatica]
MESGGFNHFIVARLLPSYPPTTSDRRYHRHPATDQTLRPLAPATTLHGTRDLHIHFPFLSLRLSRRPRLTGLTPVFRRCRRTDRRRSSYSRRRAAVHPIAVFASFQLCPSHSNSGKLDFPNLSSEPRRHAFAAAGFRRSCPRPFISRAYSPSDYRAHHFPWPRLLP